MSIDPANNCQSIRLTELCFSVAANHTVTQSTFADPCSPMPDGFNTGFNQSVAQGAAPVVVNYTVPSNVTADTPLWFFCAQTQYVLLILLGWHATDADANVGQRTTARTAWCSP